MDKVIDVLMRIDVLTPQVSLLLDEIFVASYRLPWASAVSVSSPMWLASNLSDREKDNFLSQVENLPVTFRCTAETSINRT